MKESIILKILEQNELKNIEVLNQYGQKAAYTDMYLIAGGDPNSSDMDRVPDELGLNSRVVPQEETQRIVIDTYSDVFSKICRNKTKGYNNTYEVEFGEYPQFASAHSVDETLEYYYQKMLFDESNGILIPTGKTYTIFQNGELVTYNEYYHDGKRYIRVNINEQVLLSNANTYYCGDHVWIEVSKVKWLIDETTERIISKKVSLPNIDKSYASFFCNVYMLEDMLDSSMNKKDILKMIAYVMQNVRKETESEYLKIVNEYDDISLLSLEELENVLLRISKLNDKINNFDYELTWKMK